MKKALAVLSLVIVVSACGQKKTTIVAPMIKGPSVVTGSILNLLRTTTVTIVTESVKSRLVKAGEPLSFPLAFGAYNFRHSNLTSPYTGVKLEENLIAKSNDGQRYAVVLGINGGTLPIHEVAVFSSNGFSLTQISSFSVGTEKITKLSLHARKVDLETLGTVGKKQTEKSYSFDIK